jgi:hypothetical protein
MFPKGPVAQPGLFRGPAMQDPNWELVNGAAAHEIEYINYTNQTNVIEALIIFYTEVDSGRTRGCSVNPTPRILLELHRTGTLFLLDKPGEYRDCDVHVGVPGQPPAFVPPPWQEVPGHMEDFFVNLKNIWEAQDAIAVAAYALWRLNWIHPFKNGNGRTAGAFSYACLCLKIGVFLPGAPTVLDQIMADRVPYEGAIRVADASLAKHGEANLEPMREYIQLLLTRQMLGAAASQAGS